MTGPFHSTWVVDAVIETRDGGTIADLRHVERDQANPESGITLDRVTLDVTDGPELHRGDNVRLSVEVIR